MIRPLHVILAALALHSDGQPARWEPDPNTSGLTERYVPDGYNCDFAHPWNHCTPTGQKPPTETKLFVGPAYHKNSAPKAPNPALASLSHTLQSASRAVEAAQRTGRKEDLMRASAQIEAARQGINAVLQTN